MSNAKIAKLSPEQSKQLIQDLGGTCAVARIFGISPPSVTGWGQIGLPTKRLTALRKIARSKPNGIVWTALTKNGVDPRGTHKTCLVGAAEGSIDTPGRE